MVSNDLKAWPAEYGVVFALGSCSGRVEGKVKLNKTLALLQRDGFPISNLFKNLQMGPCDLMLDETTSQMEKDHLLRIDQEATSYEWPRIIYTLREEGRNYLSEYDDLLCPLRDKPYSKALFDNLPKIKHDIQYMNSTYLINYVHKELKLDKPEMMEKELPELLNSVRKEYDLIESSFDIGCSLCLEMLGSLDFASRSLQAILHPKEGYRRITFFDYSGISFILYNSSELTDLTSTLRGHRHLLDIRENESEHVSMLRSSVLWRLHCLELNAGIYDIIQPLDIDDEEDHYDSGGLRT